MANGASTDEALVRLDEAIGTSGIAADFACVFYDCGQDDERIFAFVKQRRPEAAILGGTSLHGVMSDGGLGRDSSIGLLLIERPDGSYGTAAVSLGEDPVGSAEQALIAALDAADCEGELPELIWIYQSPGHEEEVIAGLRRVVGDRCPVIGGVTGVGFHPSGASGLVISSEGRHITEIDGEPAAVIYDRWTGGAVGEKLNAGGNILAESTMAPLGIDAGAIEGVTHHLLVHPESVGADGSLSTFASIANGTRLHAMKGDRTRLIERAAKVAGAAAAALPGGGEDLAGGLVVYCAGCRIAVGDQMEKVAESVRGSFGGQPFLGCFTFGEQGHLLDRNLHGNLMISAIAFGR